MTELLLGLTIGFAAGISPGPLMVLVVTSTLRSGWRAGALTAMAPLVTDVVVIALVLLVLDQLPGRALGLLGVIGGMFVIGVGARTVIEARHASLTPAGAQPLLVGRTLGRASIMNLTSPHPWITWFTALGPLTVATYQRGALGAVALVVGFYVALVGAKVVLALMVAGARRTLGEQRYRIALRLAGGLLIALGVLLAMEFGQTLASGT